MVDPGRMRALMGEKRLDVVAASSPDNVLYLSRANILTQRLIPDRLAFCLWPTEGEPAMVVCLHEEPQTRKDSRIKNVHSYFEFEESPVESVCRVIKDMGLEAGRIGLEKRYLGAQHYEELQTRLPRATLLAADGLFDSLRVIKTREEISILEFVAQLTDRAVRCAFEAAQPGGSERDLAAAIRQRMFEFGADELRPLMLGAGPNARFVHQLPTTYHLAEGDICRIDLGAIKEGYQSDLARTAVVGKAIDRQRDAYRRLWNVHEVVMAAVRPGTTVADLYAAYEHASQRFGVFRRRPHIGHGIGIGLHEAPFLTPSNTQTLEVGMVMCVEYTYLYESELYHVEDTLEVTPDGSRILSRGPDWSELFTLG